MDDPRDDPETISFPARHMQKKNVTIIAAIPRGYYGSFVALAPNTLKLFYRPNKPQP